MKKFSLMGAFVAGVFASSVSASQTGFICDVNDGSTGGFVRSPFVFVLNSDDKKAVVSDPIILWSQEKPLSTKMKVTNKGSYRMNWRVRNVPVVDGKISVNYRATLNPQNMTVSISGNIQGASNTIRGHGKCRDLAKDQIARLLQP